MSNSSNRMKPQSILFQVEEVFRDIPEEYTIWTRKADFNRARVEMDIRVVGQKKTGDKRLEGFHIFSYCSRDFTAPSEEGYFLSIGGIEFLYLKTTLPFWTWGNRTGEPSKFWWREKWGRATSLQLYQGFFLCTMVSRRYRVARKGLWEESSTSNLFFFFLRTIFKIL